MGSASTTASEGSHRRPRADAARNRERILQAASELFRDRGLEVPVTEIADRAGVGRATLFRNFPTKADLVTAIIAERMRAAVDLGQALLRAGEPRGGLLASLIDPIAEGQQIDRALFEGVGAEELFDSPEIQAVHSELIGVIDALIGADHAAGTIRGDIGAFDVLMLIKGACKVAVEVSGEDGRRVLARQMTLVRSAISAVAESDCPLPGGPLTPEDYARAHRCTGRA
ncbi:TetR/AcrR family transcriptional regulator [Conexibacter sp. DBS9H8]|uniref:TetR/AcrR family transcriptional regulator n=1 Tax=Conexibacter sp. DBS9H8 TaxID=2937801 RepID=UPI00200F976E|nr:TetR/AcrR family transcriptional regulator [Conexibacter sp. DBS9H8]